MITHELSTSRRPAKNKAAFLALLPPAVEFVQGSSTGALVVGHTKLKPINGPTESRAEASGSDDRASSAPRGKLGAAPSLFNGALDTTWSFAEVGAGLNNVGNTCFLNSVLQCLIHTAPLANVIKGHKRDTCRAKSFCMSCGLQAVLVDSLLNRKRSLTPHQITNGLRSIAKHMARGRQEDSHEFLRFAVDALQKSCLVGQGPKPDPKLAETTWVHRIFGGRLRSRVTCSVCSHNSDTFDNILDLSLEINGARHLNDALKKFTKVDYLNGQNKYKCEKCKKLVPAQKRFTVDQAPMVLTVHLKRFSPLGRKIANQVDYEQHLSLGDVMSEAPPAPLHYTLYGVICHAGGGPNSGHYYAYVKGGKGKWYEMNDESVAPSRPATSLKNAYILFYIRDTRIPEDASRRAVPVAAPKPKFAPIGTPDRGNGVVAAMGKKRKNQDEPSSDAPAAKKPFIGPVIPTPTVTPLKPKKADENQPPKSASTANAKAAAAAALGSLAAYGDDDEDDEDVGEKMDTSVSAGSSKATIATAAASAPTTPRGPAVSSGAVAPTSFYGSTPPTAQKRKAEDDLARSGLPTSFTSKTVTYGRKNHDKASSRLKKLRKGVTAM